MKFCQENGIIVTDSVLLFQMAQTLKAGGKYNQNDSGK